MTNVVGAKWFVSSANFDYHQLSWWHSVFLHQHTLVDIDHRGKRKQIFSRKTSEQKTYWPVKNAILPTPPVFGSMLGIGTGTKGSRKLIDPL